MPRNAGDHEDTLWDEGLKRHGANPALAGLDLPPPLGYGIGTTSGVGACGSRPVTSIQSANMRWRSIGSGSIL
jgi:hypothetical protein